MSDKPLYDPNEGARCCRSREDVEALEKREKRLKGCKASVTVYDEVSSVKELKDSGTRDSFDTGAVRDGQTGKGRMDLLPWRAIRELSKHFERGAEKYEARNWEKGIPLSRFVDSGTRHLSKFMCGEMDEPHLVAACWNFMCLLDTILRMQDGQLPVGLDDLPARTVHLRHLDYAPIDGDAL